MGGIGIKVIDKNMRRKLKQTEERLLRTPQVFKEAAKNLKKQIVTQTQRGRGTFRYRSRPFPPLRPGTIENRKRLGYGRGKRSKLTMTGRLLKAIEIGKVRKTLTGAKGDLLRIAGEQASLVRILEAGRYFGGEGAGARRAVKRKFFRMTKNRKSKMMREVVRPHVSKTLRKIWGSSYKRRRAA